MARHKAAPYYLREKHGRAVLEYRVDGVRKKAYLGIPYHPERSSAAERRAAEKAAEDKWRELTDGRVIEEHARIDTPQQLQELYAGYLTKWDVPDGATANLRKSLMDAATVRRAYGRSIAAWASDEATRPDGSKRWRNDKRTPLERLLADNGATDFLAWRLQQVTRKTMKKEKSNLCLFLDWLKSNGYIKSIPVVTLPKGAGKKALVNGRGYHIPMTPLEAAKLVAVMPEYSSRAMRRKEGGQVHLANGRFLVRPFFDLMLITGLREATLERLEVPRNWKPGRRAFRFDNEDDKAKYGREFPLPDAAVEILEEYAPSKGHIFGHHDFRRHVKAAAAIVFKDEPQKAKFFGGYHFRHFVATLLANAAGTKLPAAQFILGHKDLGTTSGYVHANVEDARELLERVEPARLEAAAAAAKWAARQRPVKEAEAVRDVVPRRPKKRPSKAA